MYFTVNSRVPSRPFPGEDAIPFDPTTVRAREVRGRWKVTSGRMWMLDFGVSEFNAQTSDCAESLVSTSSDQSLIIVRPI